MSHEQQPPDGAQDGEIEVTGLGPRLSPRARARRLIASLAAVLLALALVLGSIPSLRQGALGLLVGPTPTSTPFSLPGASSFYFLPTPPWVTVFVDGGAHVQAPLADDHAQPLLLPRGIHRLEWRGAPFQPLRCTLSTPLPFIYTPHGADACPLLPYLGLPSGYVLQERESLATLPPAQQSALQQAVAAGLSAAAASVVVQPGESYLEATQDYPYYRVVRSGAALHATLRYTVGSGWSEPCALSPTTQPCRFPDQDCRQLCTTILPPSSLPSGADSSAWIAAAPVQASWELAASNGTGVSQGLAGVGANYFLALLRITWDGANWHVTPLFGHAAGGQIADDAVCAPARDWLATPTAPSPGPLVPVGPALQGLADGIVYASGSDPADGCFVSVAPSALAFTPAPPVTQPATFLLRFGVLVAVNAVARQIAPELPVADADEQAIAQQLQAQVSGAG